MQLALMEARSR